MYHTFKQRINPLLNDEILVFKIKGEGLAYYIGYIVFDSTSEKVLKCDIEEM